MKRLRLLLLVVGIAGLTGLGVGLYLYNKPHDNLSNKKADFALSADAFFAAYDQDEEASNQKYLNKLVDVTGPVAEISGDATQGVVVILRGENEMFGINCSFEPEDAAKATTLKIGQSVTVRGLCSGKLMDVSLARCILP